MKAVRLLEYGGELVFDEVPKPTIAADEVLVKIKSTAVNHVDLVKASGTARQALPICRGYRVMSFQGSSNRLAVRLRHVRQVIPYLVLPVEWARMRSIWLSRPRSSQGNRPTSHLTRRHLCRWPPKLRGRDCLPTVIWKRDKRP